MGRSDSANSRRLHLRYWNQIGMQIWGFGVMLVEICCTEQLHTSFENFVSSRAIVNQPTNAPQAVFHLVAWQRGHDRPMHGPDSLRRTRILTRLCFRQRSSGRVRLRKMLASCIYKLGSASTARMGFKVQFQLSRSLPRYFWLAACLSIAQCTRSLLRGCNAIP